MADSNPAAFSASFPAPPPFWKYFTLQNVERVASLRAARAEDVSKEEEEEEEVRDLGDGRTDVVKEVKEENEADEGVKMETETTTTKSETDTETEGQESRITGHISAEDVAQLPLELRYLMPPTIESIRLRERERGGVAVFGRAVDVGVNVGGSGSGSGRVGAEIGTSGESEDTATPTASPTPSTLIPRLTPHLHALLLTFLSLTHTLSTTLPTDPSPPPAVTDLQTLLASAHACLNSLRPHQAREALIRMMEAEVQRKREAVSRVRELRERIGAVLGGEVGVNGQGVNAMEEDSLLQFAGFGRGRGEEEEEDSERRRDGIVNSERDRELRTWAALEEIDVG